MARARNKSQLIEFGRKSYATLHLLVNSLSSQQRDKEYLFDNRTTKDIVAHLYAWQLLEIDWYTVGMKGIKPEIPAHGYTFKDTPALNEKLFQEHKAIEWNDLFLKFETSHNRLLQIIDKHSDEELTIKAKYPWTGSTNMASYFASATSSHYTWAIDLIKKHFLIKS